MPPPYGKGAVSDTVIHLSVSVRLSHAPSSKTVHFMVSVDH